ncbi:MAG: hypothetical protein ACC608_00625 [Anaerofustis sp.]
MSEQEGLGLKTEGDAPTQEISLSTEVNKTGELRGSEENGTIEQKIITPDSDIFKNNKDTRRPSEIARSQQVNDTYPGIDRYSDRILKKNEMIYRAEPNGTGYFTTKEAIEKSSKVAKTLFEGLQVKKHREFGYRKKMVGYKATIDIESAFGVALANTDYGKGGMTQIFIPQVELLIQMGYLVLIENIELDMGE